MDTANQNCLLFSFLPSHRPAKKYVFELFDRFVRMALSVLQKYFTKTNYQILHHWSYQETILNFVIIIESQIHKQNKRNEDTNQRQSPCCRGRYASISMHQDRVIAMRSVLSLLANSRPLVSPDCASTYYSHAHHINEIEKTQMIITAKRPRM